MELAAPLVGITLGVVLFVIIWVCVSLLLAFAGGWRALARAYPAPHAPPDGGWVEREALLSGRARYKNVLRLCASDEGVFLSVAPPFRIGHPPLLVPWEDLFPLASASPAMGYTELRFGRVASPRILVPDATLVRLDESAPRPWRGS